MPLVQLEILNEHFFFFIMWKLLQTINKEEKKQ